MSERASNALELVRLISRRAPEYLDLITAQNEEQFDSAFDAVLEKAVAHLERNKRNYQKLDEVGLTGVLVAALLIPGLSVAQEQHSNGHVDLTIELDYSTPALRKLGEAKIYNGPKYHISGLEQLLRRYTTGREGRGLLIVYVRQADIAELIRKLRSRMDSDLPQQQDGPTSPHSLKWAFTSTHAHSCGEKLQVSHIGCNLHVD